MKPRFIVLAAVLVVILIGLAAVFAIPGLRWRAEVFVMKSTGELDDLSWSEVVRWSKPGSPVYLGELPKSRSPYAAIENPRQSASDLEAGSQLFRARCSPCHGFEGEGISAPSLQQLRRGGSDWALFRIITQGIPSTAMLPHDIPETDVWQVASYVRSISKKQSLGEADSLGTNSELAGRDFPSVPYERIRDSADEPHNWMTFSGAYNGRRNSALTQITPDNAYRLRLEWVFQMGTSEKMVETSPIVVDGIMYITEPPDRVIALDAATGVELWDYFRPVPSGLSLCCGMVNRGAAVLDDKVFWTTLDAHMIALRASTGRVLWDVPIADPKDHYSSTAAPIAVKDMILTGISGGDFGAVGFIAAHDAATGELRWKFESVPKPGEPGSETWADDSWKTGGAATWLTGSFDPELNLVYWGIGNPAEIFDGRKRAGDNLYSNCVVALDADTGELKWHFQFTPHDVHDWDSNQTPVLADLPYNGVDRKLMLWANRNGFYYVLDRETGEYLTAKAYIHQTWAERIDENGRPIELPGAEPSKQGTLVWPSVTGGTNWWSPSFSPQTSLFYIPTLEKQGLFFRETVGDHGDDRLMGSVAQGVTDQLHYTAVRAVDATTGNLKWEHRYPQRKGWSRVGGIVSTAGGVVFNGDNTKFYAFNAETGELLWQIPMGGTINAAPVTYMVNGKQLVTIAAGRSIFTFGLGPE